MLFNNLKQLLATTVVALCIGYLLMSDERSEKYTNKMILILKCYETPFNGKMTLGGSSLLIFK
jgi:hypothetical protein